MIFLNYSYAKFIKTQIKRITFILYLQESDGSLKRIFAIDMSTDDKIKGSTCERNTTIYVSIGSTINSTTELLGDELPFLQI